MESRTDRATSPSGKRQARRRVLVVDDEPLIGPLLGKLLGSVGDVEFRLNLADAIAYLESGVAIDAVLCDLALTDGPGERLRHWAAEHRPPLVRRIGYITGGACNAAAQSFLDRERPPYLLKPFSRQELLEFTDALFSTDS